MNQLRILRIADVIARTGLSRSSIYAQMADGTFPAQVKLGRRAVGWSGAEIDEWIARCLAGLQEVK